MSQQLFQRDCLMRLRWFIGGMDGESVIRAWNSDSFFQIISCFLVSNLECYFSQRCCIAENFAPFVYYWQSPLANVSEFIGKLFANRLFGFRGYCQSSDKFLRVYWQLGQIVHIFQRVANILLRFFAGWFWLSYGAVSREYRISSRGVYNRVAPLERKGNLFAIPL
jgi:hypothetical protein